MERLKKAARKLFCIHWAAALVLAILAAAALIWVFALGNEASPLAGVGYALSFYALVTVCVSLAPAVIRWSRAWQSARANRDAAQKEKGFRMSLLLSLCIKLAYAGFHLISGAVVGSIWMLSMGLYYLVLAVIRMVLAVYERKLGRLAAEAERHRLSWTGFQVCGVLLLFLHLTATGVVFQIIRDGPVKEYGQIMVIANAAYTFYRMISAIVSVVRHHQNPSPIWGASRNLGLTEAMMSMFFLQAAMLSAFDGEVKLQQLMNSLTGSAVCILAVLGAIGMIVHGQKRKQINGDMEYGA